MTNVVDIICEDIECKMAYLVAKVDAMHILVSNHMQHHNAIELAMVAVIGGYILNRIYTKVKKNGT